MKLLSEIICLLARIFILIVGFFALGISVEWWQKALSVLFIVLVILVLFIFVD